MELDKLHIADFDARPVRHRNSISSGNSRVRRVLVHLTNATRRQQHRGGLKGLHHFGMGIEHIEPEHTIALALKAITTPAEFVLGQELDRKVMLKRINAWTLSDRMQQGLLDGFACDILHVQNATLRVPALFTKRDTTIIQLSKFHPTPYQFVDTGRPILKNLTHCRLITKTIAGIQRVRDVHLHVIRLRGDCRNPPCA